MWPNVDLSVAIIFDRSSSVFLDVPQSPSEQVAVSQIPAQKGIEQGIEQGIRQGEGTLLLRLIELKFGAADEAVVRQIREADPDTRLQWSERILTAETLSDLLR